MKRQKFPLHTPLRPRAWISSCLLIMVLALGNAAACKAQATDVYVSDAERANVLKTLIAGLKNREELLESKTIYGEATEKEFVSEAHWNSLDGVRESWKEARKKGHYADRDMARFRFSLAQKQWLYEIQQLLWSGANYFFKIDYSRKATDVSDLYRRVACDGEKIYRFGHNPYGGMNGRPMGAVEILDKPYTGLTQLGARQWLSAGFRNTPFSQMLAMDGTVKRLRDVEKETLRGRATYKVTFVSDLGNFLMESRVWIAPDAGFAVLKWENLSIYLAEVQSGERQVLEWFDFKDANGIILPQRYVEQHFDYKAGRTDEDTWRTWREVTFQELKLRDDPVPNVFEFAIRLGTILDGWNGGALNTLNTTPLDKVNADWKKSQEFWKDAEQFQKADLPEIEAAYKKPLTGQEKYNFLLPQDAPGKGAAR